MDERVDNRVRFLNAAEHMLRKLMQHRNAAAQDIDAAVASLRDDLDRAIGPNDPRNALREDRIKRYQALALTGAYGLKRMPLYDQWDWFEEAINEEVRFLNDRKQHLPAADKFFEGRLNFFPDFYTWRDQTAYQNTDWFRFQEAVKAHQKATLAHLAAGGLDIEQLPNA